MAATRQLAARIAAWRANPTGNGDALPPGAPFPPLASHAVRGQEPWSVYQFSQLVFTFMLTAATAFALGSAIGLPEREPFAQSLLFAGLVSGVGAVLLLLPVWWEAQRLKRQSAQAEARADDEAPAEETGL